MENRSKLIPIIILALVLDNLIFSSAIAKICEIVCEIPENRTENGTMCCWKNATYVMSSDLLEPTVVAPRADACYVYSYVAFVLSILANTGVCYYGTTNRRKIRLVMVK